MFRFDTHVHTSEVSPCGQISAEDTVKFYVCAGFSGICITDHYYRKSFDTWNSRDWNDTAEKYLSGYRAARKAGARKNLDVLLGAEIMFDGSPNEYLLYGVTEEFILRNPRLYEYPMKDFWALAKKNDILIYQAHPFRKNLTREDPRFLDGVEVINGNLRHESHNEQALEFARVRELPGLGGSDCHKPEDVGKSGIITKERIRDMDALKAVLRAGAYEMIPL